MAEFRSEPIEPGGLATPGVNRFLAEWHDLPRGTRVLALIYLLIGGIGAVVGSYALASDVHRWWAWVISLVVLEPIAVVSFLALVVLAAPRSVFSQFLEGALRRARVIAVGFIVAYVALIIGLFAFVGREIWRSR